MLSVKRLDLADARVLIAGAKVKAAEIGVPMCIAVTDESGNLIALEKMDGAKTPGVTLAIDKSFTASGTRKPTHELQEASQPGKPAFGVTSALGGRMVVIAGGVPIQSEGVVVGAIGVSSGTADQDLEVAEAGIRALVASATFKP